MNKILFKEGGQPVYLDDLKQIQTNNLITLKQLLRSLVESDRNTDFEEFEEECPCNLLLYENNITEGEEENTIVVPGNVLVYLGYLLPFEGGTFPSSSTLYVCVKETLSDLRTFKDGAENYCRKNYTAYLSTSDDGADGHFVLDNLHSMVYLLRERLWNVGNTWETLDISWRNGYSGTMRRKRINGGYRYKILSRSSNRNWISEEGVGLLGVFQGQNTNQFTFVSAPFMTGADQRNLPKPHVIERWNDTLWVVCIHPNITCDTGPNCHDIDITFDVLDSSNS